MKETSFHLAFSNVLEAVWLGHAHGLYCQIGCLLPHISHIHIMKDWLGNLQSVMGFERICTVHGI